MHFLDTLHDLTPDYEAFIFDVYGVLHNGIQAIPPVVSFLKELQEKGKTVCILSNAPFMTRSVVQRLQNYGLSPSLYQHILTAGEETRRHLCAKDTPEHTRLGNKCYFLGLPEMEEILEGTALQKCSQVEEADFFLAAGPNEWGQNLDDYQEVLDQALQQNLPMVCANPDHYVYRGLEKRLRAGRLAHAYATKGGHVIYHGKPHRNFYKPILDEISEIPLDKILCIGDSLKTDAKGAHTLGIPFLLMLSPLTYHELDLPYVQAPLRSEDKKNILTEISKQVYTPHYLCQLPDPAGTQQQAE